MTVRATVVLALVIVCLGGLVLAQEEEAPLQNWTAPPYWQPTVQGMEAEGQLEGGLIARSQGLLGEPQALPSAPLPFVAIAPCRIIDTRPGYELPPPFGGPTFAAGETRTYGFSVSATCPGIPATAGAYSLNLHAKTTTIPGFITVWPTGMTRPTASNFVSVPTENTAVAAIVPAGTAGQINAYCNSAGDVWIDINGYYGPQSVVTSLNTKTGDVTLAPGNNVTITPSGQTLTIAATGGPGGELPLGSANQTLRHNGSVWVASSVLTNDGTNVAVSANLGLPATSATAGQLLLGGTRFLHSWGAFSTYVGPNAGNTSAGGSGGNTAVGFQGLHSLSSGFSNTSVGSVALESNTVGIENTALGAGAMRFNTTASFNTAVGLNALETQSFDNGGANWGSYNTAIGHAALFANQPTTTNNGSYNTAVGATSLLQNTIGASNTAVGAGSLGANTTAAGNTAVGAWSLGANTIAEGNTAIGTGAMGSNTAASSNTAVGWGALQTQSFSNGGTVWESFNTAVGNSALRSNQPTTTTNGIENTAVGAKSLTSNTIGAYNTALGGATLMFNQTAAGNTAIGSTALAQQSYNNGGVIWWSYNTAVGYAALTSNNPTNATTGVSNTAVGAASLFSNFDGSRNTAVGTESLYTTHTGNDNVAIGYQALWSNNSGVANAAVGRYSAFHNVGGIENTAVGTDSLYSNNGNANVAVGVRAMYDCTTGNGNVAIGENSAAGFNGNNQLFIGNGYGTLIWGDFANKRVAIGMTNGSYQLQLAADSAGKPNGGSWANSSDARLKRGVAPLSGALERILQLQGVSFEWINPGEHGGNSESAGFIAQDVERVFPDWVTMIEPTGADRELVAPGERVRSLSLPFAFDAFLVEALREQQAQIEAQTVTIQELRAEIDALRGALQARERDVEHRLAALEEGKP